VHYIIIIIILYNNKYRTLDIFTHIIIILFILVWLAGVFWGKPPPPPPFIDNKHFGRFVDRTARHRLALNYCYYYYCSHASCAYNVTHTSILLLLQTNVIISACKRYTTRRTDLPMLINGILCVIAILLQQQQ